MHQNQWLAAITELQMEGVENLPVPSKFPLDKEERDVAYQYINFSDGAMAKEGTWADGPSPDGHGEFTYTEAPTAGVPMPPPPVPDPRLYGTVPLPGPGLISRAADKVKDALSGD
jgi:Mn-containing catalase